MNPSFTYILCKSKINNKMYTTQEEMQVMLDVFYAGGRISQDEYLELTQMLVAQNPPVVIDKPTDPTEVEA